MKCFLTTFLPSSILPTPFSLLYYVRMYLCACCCCRCLLEKDPIAQKHAARIKKLRGTYDRYGNRRPPEFIASQKKTKRWKKRPTSDDRGRNEC